ncbi:MAG: ABC transporter permease [Candidatus Marinimicrobia bacterium]|nr:ABC transporter permease [Candidatus Neomarinimicrobiota bacterium]MCF7839797.1 ABC transporter permease [Candidatus Neomarinimicrobiota bacterium]
MLRKIVFNFIIAVEAIFQNKTRAFLTSLGIIFGVASVIAMLAIGNGARQEILSQMQLLGVNNIIVQPVVKQEEGKVEEELGDKSREKRFTPGLTLADATAVAQTIPKVRFVSPEIVMETMVVRSGLKRTGKLVGVNEYYFDTSEFELQKGEWFNATHLTDAMPVCIIGHGIATKFFPREPPLGRRIKTGNLWLTVVGVLKERKITEQNIQHLGIRDYNMDIYTPVRTMLLRYKNRALVTKQDIMETARQENGVVQEIGNYHQLDRMVVRVEDSEYIQSVAEVMSRMLQRRHNDVVDYEIIIPEQLLEQEQRTKNIFNIVLGAIASISLVVGGIGIMNIMLASVMERIREIGIRLALGATKMDIILQFILEAITISLVGGILGIFLGMAMSWGIERFTHITTIVSGISIVVSFVVSFSVGLAFGSFPAKRAAEQDPIVSLRYE